MSRSKRPSAREAQGMVERFRHRVITLHLATRQDLRPNSVKALDLALDFR